MKTDRLYDSMRGCPCCLFGKVQVVHGFGTVSAVSLPASIPNIFLAFLASFGMSSHATEVAATAQPTRLYPITCTIAVFYESKKMSVMLPAAVKEGFARDFCTVLRERSGLQWAFAFFERAAVPCWCFDTLPTCRLFARFSRFSRFLCFSRAFSSLFCRETGF